MRRKRVELEAAIVLAAQNYIVELESTDLDHGAETRELEARFDLRDAVKALNAYLPLEPAARGAWVEGSPETSVQAALTAPRGQLGKRVLAHIRVAHYHGGVGSTDDALEAALHRSHQSVSSARNGLCMGGWLMDSGQRRKTRTGRDAVVWTLTPSALTKIEQDKETA